MKIKIYTDIHVPESLLIKNQLVAICQDFIDNDILLLDNNIKGETIWEIEYFLEKYNISKANKKILLNIFETIKVYEQNFPSVGEFLIRYFASNFQEYSTSKKYRPSFGFALNSTFKTLNTDNDIKDMFKVIKKYGNSSVAITINREPIEKPIIKFTKNPSVRLRIAEGFLPREKYFKNCKWLMIDGAIANISEIMNYLNASFEDKENTYFLVCKSFNSEILYTLKENYDRCLTNIIPIEYGYDLESINSLADLVSLVGGSPLTPHLGDIISSYKENRLGTSQYVKIDKNFCFFPGIKNLYHLKNLNKKINNSNEETKKILNKRLQRLKGNSCSVLLPNNNSYNKLEMNIKHSILLLNSFCKNYIYIYKIKNKNFYLSGNAHLVIENVLLQIKDLLNLKLCILKN